MSPFTLSVVVFVLTAIPALAEQVAYKQIKLDPPVEGLGGSIEMGLEVLKPAVVFFGDKTIRGNPPAWALTKLFALNLTSEDVPQRFTPDYLLEYGAPELGRNPPEIYSSVTHGVFVKREGSVYVFTSGSFSSEQAKLPTESPSYGTSLLTTEGWKRAVAPKWSLAIPINDVEKLQAILDRGAANLVNGELEPAPAPNDASSTFLHPNTSENPPPSADR